jgi:hypothetical protein
MLSCGAEWAYHPAAVLAVYQADPATSDQSSSSIWATLPCESGISIRRHERDPA